VIVLKALSTLLETCFTGLEVVSKLLETVFTGFGVLSTLLETAFMTFEVLSNGLETAFAPVAVIAASFVIAMSGAKKQSSVLRVWIASRFAAAQLSRGSQRRGAAARASPHPLTSLRGTSRGFEPRSRCRRL
jgi:hypothetical protein